MSPVKCEVPNSLLIVNYDRDSKRLIPNGSEQRVVEVKSGECYDYCIVDPSIAGLFALVDSGIGIVAFMTLRGDLNGGGVFTTFLDGKMDNIQLGLNTSSKSSVVEGVIYFGS